MKKVPDPDPAGQKSPDPTGSGSGSGSSSLPEAIRYLTKEFISPSNCVSSIPREVVKIEPASRIETVAKFAVKAIFLGK